MHSTVISTHFMTIESKWVGILKRQFPTSFSNRCPFTPECVVLDGMPMLMVNVPYKSSKMIMHTAHVLLMMTSWTHTV